ncbi:DNA-binding protein [Pseudooceanicola sp. LIPI14-2-Ac024]|uniref:helix-turn-helix domain-containing transcriptional regulator n=1 Tax=Pseudooceanicola sp. LIPI14-2-Ac024 TaxID=3344875 RepID=UPI0035CF5BB7
MIETSVFDVADHLDDPEAQREFLCDALETGEGAYIAHAFSIVARARGEDAGDDQVAGMLAQAKAEGDGMTVTTLAALCDAFGLVPCVVPKPDAPAD